MKAEAQKPYTLLFGLTADPIHKGHEQVIINSFKFAKQQQLNFEQLLLVPTFEPNLIATKKQPQTPFKQRFEMCELVAESIREQFNYPVYITDIERQLFELNGVKSYSYDTLHATEVAHKLFVLSADHFTGRWPKFRQWYRWQQLVEENGLLIHQRPGHGINASFIEQLKDLNPDVYVVTGLPEVDVSSTQMRAALRAQQTISKDHMAASVLQYIRQHKVYG